MTVVCAWCQRLGRPAVLREKEPLDMAVITHGICDEHVLMVRAEARRWLAGESITPRSAEVLSRVPPSLRDSPGSGSGKHLMGARGVGS